MRLADHLKLSGLGERNMTLPFVGHPVGAPSGKAALNDKNKIESAYRFLFD